MHAFTAYESRRTLEDEPFTRGINSVQLLEHDGRYWILHVVWDSERADSPIPERYLQFEDRD